MIDVNKIKIGDKLKLESWIGDIDSGTVVTVVEDGTLDSRWITKDFVEISELNGVEEWFSLVETSDVERIRVLTSDHEYQGLYRGTIHNVTNIVGDIVEFKLHGKTWTLVGDEYELYEEPLSLDAKPDSALDKQEGGGHYKGLKIQPIEYIHANGLSYFQGNVVKYVSRYKDKNGAEDLKKAIHYLELILELEYGIK